MLGQGEMLLAAKQRRRMAAATHQQQQTLQYARSSVNDGLVNTGYGASGYSGYGDSTPPRSDHLYPEAVENDRYIANGGLASCARPMG